jgi:hypothetical protein
MGLTISCVEAAPVQSMEFYYYVNYHFYLGRALIVRVEKLFVLNIFLGILQLYELDHVDSDAWLQ